MPKWLRSIHAYTAPSPYHYYSGKESKHGDTVGDLEKYISVPMHVSKVIYVCFHIVFEQYVGQNLAKLVLILCHRRRDLPPPRGRPERLTRTHYLPQRPQTISRNSQFHPLPHTPRQVRVLNSSN